MRRLLLILWMLIAGYSDLKTYTVSRSWLFGSLVFFALNGDLLRYEPLSWLYCLVAIPLFLMGWIGSMDLFVLGYIACFLKPDAMNGCVLIAALLGLIYQKKTKKELVPFVTFLVLGFVVSFLSQNGFYGIIEI